MGERGGEFGDYANRDERGFDVVAVQGVDALGDRAERRAVAVPGRSRVSETRGGGMGFGRGRRRRDAGRNDAVIVETVDDVEARNF